jgi:hypothetical protein
VVRPAKLFIGSELTTIKASRYRARASRPSARNKVASRLLIDRASTPQCCSFSNWLTTPSTMPFQQGQYLLCSGAQDFRQ